MMVWLNRAPPSIFTAFSRVFCYSSLDFYCSEIPLNISEYFALTIPEPGAAVPHRHNRKFIVIFPLVTRLTHNQNIRATLLQNRDCAVPAFANRQAPVWRVNMALMPTVRCFDTFAVIASEAKQSRSDKDSRGHPGSPRPPRRPRDDGHSIRRSGLLAAGTIPAKAIDRFTVIPAKFVLRGPARSTGPTATARPA